MEFKKILKKIKEQKIHGSINRAKASMGALNSLLEDSNAAISLELMKELKLARDLILNASPSEIAIKNSLKYVFQGAERLSFSELKKKIKQNIDEVNKHFDLSEENISKIGSKKIKKGAVIFTLGHSSSVIDILAEAKNKKTMFSVNVAETRPSFQGRITAAELSHLKIPVNLYVDSAIREALKKADIILVGAKAITSEGIISNIGVGVLAEIAERYDVPFYVCTDSWKFDKKTTLGFEEPIWGENVKEIWENPPKNVSLINQKFEKVDSKLITGIISELGIYKPSIFIEEIKRNYKWI